MPPIQQTKRVLIVLFDLFDFLVKDIVVAVVVFKYLITVHHLLLLFTAYIGMYLIFTHRLIICTHKKHRSTLTVKLRKTMLCTEATAKSISW